MKLLITSVGSLLGQNILDSIESRRSLINVVGIDSSANNHRNYRCDTVYLVPLTDSVDFLSSFTKIIEKEKPDFILPGRDGDSIVLSDLKSSYPDKFSRIIPLGSSVIPRILLDKYKTHLFSQKNNLAFADTLLFKDNRIELNEFVSKYGFPLVVKPSNGFGSHGVYFVLDEEQLNEIVKEEEVLFQEYLGNPEDIFKYKDVFKKGIPLFFQIPEEKQYAAQTIISPDGTVGEVFITINTMVLGRAEFIKQIRNKEIEELVYEFSREFYKNGWYGSINFQLKPDRNGKWKVFELNSRLTGTSSGRALLGYDEFGILADIFIPEFNIPNLTKLQKVKGSVVKYLYDSLILDENTEQLNANKVWKKY